MTKKEIKEVEISIFSAPTLVRFECPYCEEEIEISYDDFCDKIGAEYCDWCCSKFQCPECDEYFEISYVEWD